MTMDRILWFDGRIRDGHYPGSADLAANFKVSLRTAQRDIEFLRDRIRAPLRYDAERKGFSYGDPGFCLPLGFFRKEELIALLYARRLFKEVPSPLGEEAAAVSARLEELFRATALAGVEEAISFDAGRKAEGSDRVFFDLLRAVIRRRVVRLHLDAPAEGESAVLEVEPLKLHVSAGSLRLVGHSRGRKGARIYPLGRIRRVEVTARQFAPPDTPVDAEALVRKGFRDGTARNVRIRFGPERAEWAAAQTGHPNRRLQWELDGSVVLELPETRFLEVLGLLLLSGGDAVVAAPAGLREAVRAEVERLAADYPAVSGPGRASPRKRKIFSAGKTGSK